jgi:hypothetical protein
MVVNRLNALQLASQFGHGTATSQVGIGLLESVAVHSMRWTSIVCSSGLVQYWRQVAQLRLLHHRAAEADIQLQFVMLDPYIRLPLQHVGQSGSSLATYRLRYKVPACLPASQPACLTD